MDNQEVLDLIDRVYGSLMDPTGWQSLVEATASALDAEAGDLFVEDSRAGESQDFGWFGYDNNIRLAYDRHFLGNEPFIRELLGKPAGRAWVSRLDPNELDRSDCFNLWLRPQGLRHEIGAIFEQTPDRVITAGFARASDRVNFSENEERALTQIVPHLF